MFGPIRGAWDEDWRGWWGPEPPYHAPVFVLTHHAREPIEMEAGTTFHFVTGGFDAAYTQACEAAGEDGVDIAGGAATVRQALIAGVIDELTLDIAPVLLGSGGRSSTASNPSGWSPSRCCIRRWSRTSATAGPGKRSLRPADDSRAGARARTSPLPCAGVREDTPSVSRFDGCQVSHCDIVMRDCETRPPGRSALLCAGVRVSRPSTGLCSAT